MVGLDLEPALSEGRRVGGAHTTQPEKTPNFPVSKFYSKQKKNQLSMTAWDFHQTS